MQRLFTPSEANATLPLVRRIVIDILSAGQRARAAADSATASLQADSITRQRHSEVGSTWPCSNQGV
jgi:hypothetical protein